MGGFDNRTGRLSGTEGTFSSLSQTQNLQYCQPKKNQQQNFTLLLPVIIELGASGISARCSPY